MPRTIVIGDIHGCANEFEELLLKIAPQPKDRLIQIGDLINRGPNSHRVIELCRSYNIEAILGNHELRILKAQYQDKSSLLKEYDKRTIEQLTVSDWKYLKSLPGYIYDFSKDVIFVHGGFLHNQLWQTQSAEIYTSIQVIDKNGSAAKQSDAPDSPLWADAWPHDAPFAIYGHTPYPEVLQRDTSLCIDTGCVYGGKLTAYILEEKAFIQVPARQAYASSKRIPSPEVNASVGENI